MESKRSPGARLIEELRRHGISDEAVLQALGSVRREDFVEAGDESVAYENRPLPIGSGQTISQPYVVALMTAAAEVGVGDRVLEIGTGSGYQAAVLGALGCEVYSIEARPELAEIAAARLQRDDWRIHLRVGDGRQGWPEEAPFDAIIVTAAPAAVPPALLGQLGPGSRMIIPEGAQAGTQRLYRYRMGTDGQTAREDLGAVRFVPLIGGRD
jgi:protein-L-isoaspartate(D-aspartate) O-methyltransferase